jgi:hypothetical protein
MFSGVSVPFVQRECSVSERSLHYSAPCYPVMGRLFTCCIVLLTHIRDHSFFKLTQEQINERRLEILASSVTNDEPDDSALAQTPKPPSATHAREATPPAAAVAAAVAPAAPPLTTAAVAPAVFGAGGDSSNYPSRMENGIDFEFRTWLEEVCNCMYFTSSNVIFRTHTRLQFVADDALASFAHCA